MLAVPVTVALGWTSIGIGVALFLWGVRIHGRHIWQAWWRGAPSPFRVKAGINNFDYEHGSMVAGIPWEQGFSHVYVKVTNAGSAAADDVDVFLAPEHPIIRSSARCGLAECRIGPLHGTPQVTVLMDLPDGRSVAKPHDWNAPGNYSIEPSHRLRCERLPSGAEIDIDLATVVPEVPPTDAGFWKKTRSDPASIRIMIAWAEGGCTYAVDQYLDLKGIDHGKRS